MIRHHRSRQNEPMSASRGCERQICAGLTLLAFAAGAVPQVGMAQTAEAADARIEQIIVTARKREESLRDIPVAATAVTADALERNNMRSVADIATLTPGLNINSDSPSRAFVAIRGVGTTFQSSVQPGVGIFIDGVYQPNTSYLNNPALDIERIEVLRGPQGTLYGKNTLGGAINVITRQPEDVLRGQVSGGYNDGNDARFLAAAVSGPLVPGKLQARIAASTEESNGFWTNRLIGGRVMPQDIDSVTGALRWQIADDTELTISAYRSEISGGDMPYSDLLGPRDYRDNVVMNVLNRSSFEYTGINAKLVTDLPGLDTVATVILAYDTRDNSSISDADFTRFDVVRGSGKGELETKTAELRLDTKLSDRFSTLFGLFASRSSAESLSDSHIPAAGLTSTSFNDRVAETYAVFGTLFWSLASDLELSAGLRYDHEDVDAEGHSFTSVAPTNIVATPPASIKAREVQPRVSLTKFWPSGVMTYGSIARGYRGGGINPANAPQELRTYKGDSVWTYEIGSKFDLLDNRLYLASAIFYNDYRDFIGNNSLALSPSGGLVAVDLNTGDVRSYGFETELTARLTPYWSVNGALTLQHARISDARPYFESTGRRLPSDRLLFQPDWSVHLETNYEIPLPHGELTLRGAVTGKGKRDASSFDQVEATVLDEYFVTDASVTYRLDGFSLSLFAKNLFDEKYFESYIDDSALLSLGLPGSNLGVLGNPRTIGVRARYEF